MITIKINDVCRLCKKADVCSKKEATKELIKYCEDRLKHLENGHLSMKFSCIHNDDKPIFEG